MPRFDDEVSTIDLQIFDLISWSSLRNKNKYIIYPPCSLPSNHIYDKKHNFNVGPVLFDFIINLFF
jgi:hypothetical protein